MVHNAGWCRACDAPVWLPHEEHPEAIVVQYDGGKPPRLRSTRPRAPELAEIKEYRGLLASELLEAGGVEEAVAVLEDLLKHVDRAGADQDEALLDYAIVADLAQGLIRLWRLETALAVLGRLPLNARRLDEPRRRALAYRAIAHARLGEMFYARRDRDRLYAHDPNHRMLQLVDKEIAGGVDTQTQASHPQDAASEEAGPAG
jgi:hypothetical protein